MPHVRLRFVSEDKVLELSENMIPELAALTQAPVEHFTLELVETRLYLKGRPSMGDPFCEVFWFDRGQALQDQAAEIITRYLKKIKPEGDVVVYFSELRRESYYENGRHFGPH